MVQEPLFVTNRMVVVVLPKAPFVEWINGFSRGVANRLARVGPARESARGADLWF
jgi:hypothetical protein